MHIPIVDSRVLTQKTPDYLLIIAWRMRDEILPKVNALQKRGMSIVIPLPKVEIIEWDKTNDVPRAIVLNA